jgi:NAD(P)-dependent dehydrogenase (short-subunit alcohol dehydrogenase family)
MVRVAGSRSKRALIEPAVVVSKTCTVYLRTVRNTLNGKIAVVAGASRGCGRGIALALGDAGATVYVTGRTTRTGPKPVDDAPGTVEETADEVTRRSGRGIPVQVDHTDPTQVQELFERVGREQGRLDILACAVWGGNERFVDPVWQQPFWNQPVRVWDEFMGAGPKAFWIAAHGAARLMSKQRAGLGSGLIVAITEPMIDDASTPYSGHIQWDLFEHLPHYSLNRLIATLAPGANAAGIAIIGILPGFMRTERVEMHLRDEELRRQFRYDLAESTEYAGRAVAALAADPNVLAKAGELIFAADAAKEYGFTDIDGRYIENFYRAAGRIST